MKRKNNNKEYPNGGKKWSEEGTKKVVQTNLDKKLVKDLSEELLRTPKAIRDHYYIFQEKNPEKFKEYQLNKSDQTIVDDFFEPAKKDLNTIYDLNELLDVANKYQVLVIKKTKEGTLLTIHPNSFRLK